MKEEKNFNQEMIWPIMILIGIVVGIVIAILLESNIGNGIGFGMSFGYFIATVITFIKSRSGKK